MTAIVFALATSFLLFGNPFISLIIFVSFIFFNLHKRNKIILFLCTIIYCFLVNFFARNIFTYTIDKVMVVVDVKDNYIIVQNFFHKFYVSISNNTYEVGDIIALKGETLRLKMHAIEGHFDFQNYLEHKGIFFEIKNYEIEILINSFFPKRKILNNWLEPYSAQSKDFIRSFVFGLSRGEFLKEYSNTSIAYFLGLNNYLLTTLFFGVNALMRKLTKKSEIVTLLVLMPYLLFVYDKTCFLRLVVYLFVFAFLKEKYQLNYENCLKIIFVIYIVISPFNVFNEGLMLPLLLSFLLKFIKQFKARKILKTILIYITFSLVGIVKENILTIFAPLYRIMILPIIFVFYLFSFFSVSFESLIVFHHRWSVALLKTFDFLLYFDLKIYLYPDIISPTIACILFMVVLFGFYINHKKIIEKCSILFCLSITILATNIHNYIFDYVCFLDVGQGDCALLIHKNKGLLIDTGGLLYEDLATTTLIPFFNKFHLKNIDTVICSHSDFDHIGALNSLKEHFLVERVLSKKEDFPFNFYGIQIYNLNNYEAQDNNDTSLVNYFSFMNKNFLFLGDASANIERKIIQEYDLSDVDIVKVSHHGSKSGSCQELLQEIKPCIAIMSLGFKNIYGFPNEEVLTRFKENNIEVHRTDEEGTIIYKKISI